MIRNPLSRFSQISLPAKPMAKPPIPPMASTDPTAFNYVEVAFVLMCLCAAQFLAPFIDCVCVGEWLRWFKTKPDVSILET